MDRKIILTDLGGVVLKFNECPGSNIIYDKFSVLSGLPVEEVGKIIGFNNSLHREFGRGRINSQEFYRKLCAKLKIKIDFSEFRLAWCDIFLPNAPVIDLMRKFRKLRYRICLLSNIDELHWEWIRSYFGSCIDFLDYAYLSFNLGCLKPEDEIFVKVLNDCRQKNRNARIVFIDDLENNVIAAEKCGIPAIKYVVGRDRELVEKLEKMGIKAI
jgi:putative hydrolase of the HAD superfamily